MPELLNIDLNEDVERALDAIPSATTASERKMALHFAAQLWDGQGDVFENGPLLGGITRALGIGMLHNERQNGAKLHTYDWFSLRQPLDVPVELFPLWVEEGSLPKKVYDEALREQSFLPIFTHIHHGQPYAPFIEPHVGWLPGHRDEQPLHGEQTFAPVATDYTLIFIDGCKSWYGTKYWLQQLCPHIPVGSLLLFQDFGWHTCFWLPSLIGLLEDHFKMRGYVDNTYAFELLRPISVEDVEVFPDEPDGLEQDVYSGIFSKQITAAAERGDRPAIARLSCQLAAAYAYCGDKKSAREILEALMGRYEFWPMREYLKSARRSPTYYPDGTKVTL